MKTAVTLTLASVLLMSVAGPAVAYVGPGAGLSLLGALWGLLTAVFAAIAFVVAWPFRRLLGRKRKQREQQRQQVQEQTPESSSTDRDDASADARSPR